MPPTKDSAPQSGGIVKYYYCPHPVIDRVLLKAAFDATREVIWWFSVSKTTLNWLTHS
jgi:hypothetical protein